MPYDNNDYSYDPVPAYDGRYGHPVYDQIGDYFKQATGVDATHEQVSQWGTNVDSGYMAKIRSAIDNTPEAQAARAKQTQQATPTPTPTPPPTPAATGSPVTANGQIPPQAPGLQPAPQPATRGAEPNQTRYVQKVDLSSVPAYQKTNFNVPIPTGYKAGANLPTVDPFAGPDQSGNDASQNALMQAILANPQTMNPTVIAQMQEANKEQALLTQMQEQQQADSGAAASGRLGSGYAAASTAARRQAAIDSILKGNRDINMGAVATNRADELNALGASEALASGQLGRQTSAYGAKLAGNNAALQSAIAGEGFKQAEADSAFRNAGLGFSVQQAQAAENQFASQEAVQRLLSQFGINMGVATNAQQNFTGDLSKTLGQNSQMLEYLRYLESQRQFDDQLGFNYNNLDQNGQISLMDFLTR